MCWNAVLTFTPDSRRLVAASTGFASDGNVYAWGLPAGKRRIITQGQEASLAAALVPPGRWLVAGGKEWTAFLLDLRAGKVAAGLPHPTEVNAMAASPDGRTVATGDANGTIRFWSIPAQAPRQ